MMRDQHDNILKVFYNNAISKTKKYIEKKYVFNACDNNDSEFLSINNSLPENYKYSSNYWKVVIDSANSAIGKLIFLIIVPDCFPDHFPRIYITQSYLKKIYPIPHVDKNGFICTRDPEVVVLNDKIPEKALDELIQIAVRIIVEGINKTNQHEFDEEFLAYWNDNAKYQIISLFDPEEETAILPLFKLSSTIFGCHEIICNSEDFLFRWLKKYNSKVTSKKDGLYIPLPSKSLPFIETFEDAMSFFKSLEKEEINRALENYYSKNLEFYLIICSVVRDREKMLFGWIHQGWKQIDIKGFRKGRAPLDLILINDRVRRSRITKVLLRRLDENRLQGRIS